jgi:homocysteine S-methyltransferase
VLLEQLCRGRHARDLNPHACCRQITVCQAAVVDAVLPTILDGGLATELERRGHDLSDDLWSARLLRDDPDAIIATHLSFFRAGADVATTASYQASFDGFARHGLSTAQAERLMRSSVELARVAASVGPYGAVRADGSEYSGDYGVSDARLGDFHRSRMAVLADAGADLLALETVPSQQEATVLLELLEEMPAGTSAWLSLTCADARRTRRGEDVAAVFELAASSGRLVAVGVNCTAPQHVAALVRTAVEASGKPAIAYPNSGEGWDAEARSWSGPGAVVDPAMAREWVTAGATYVGGCCRVGSADIAGLAVALG